MCEDGLTDKTYFNQCYNEAVELTAYLCKLYNLDPQGTITYAGVKVPTILCHYDTCLLGLGGNHGDVYNWFNKHGKTMQNVRDDVEKLLKGSDTPPVDVNYQCKVTANDGLNCRTTYSVSGSIITTYPKGTVLTITKEKNGWGYTGKGWVSLAYTEKVSPAPTPTPTPTPPPEPDPGGGDMTLEEFKKLWAELSKEWMDNDASDWSKEAREWVTKNGLICGIGAIDTGDPNFAWEAIVTREQLATIMYRFAQFLGKA